MRCVVPILASVVLVLSAGMAGAQTSYPMLGQVAPAAARRGETTEIAITGAGSFAGAREMLCEGPGITGKVLDVQSPQSTGAAGKGRGRGRNSGSVKASLIVAPDAPLGPREIRVATPQGASSVGLVVVVDDPIVREADDRANDRPETAQPLVLPAVACGTIGKPEDVDWYTIQAVAGQRTTFSVWGNRLENKIHDLQTHFDPIVAIHDSRGRELAVDDNHDFADPRLTYEFKEPGTYLVQIRDTGYAGNANWSYVLHATSGPVVTSVLPMAVNPGKTATLQARGANFDASRKITLDVPANLPAGVQLLALPTAQGATLPVPMVVTPLPVVLEENDAPAATEASQAVSLPAAICGRLNDANDIDAYRFEAKKGQVYHFEVVARRAGAAIDPVVRIQNARDATQTESDDMPAARTPDSNGRPRPTGRSRSRSSTCTAAAARSSAT